MKNDYDHTLQEKQEIEKKQLEQHTINLEIQSNLREKGHNYTRLEKDIERMSLEIYEYKESLATKDQDIRSMMTQLYELQRVSMEEKTTLKGDVT